MIVLDASARLAFLFRERGHDLVAPVVSSSCMSAVNLAEVLGRFARDGKDFALVQRRLRASGIEFAAFGAQDAARAAALVPLVRHLGLSLGDCACLALGQARKATVMSADHAWGEIDLEVLGVDLELIR